MTQLIGKHWKSFFEPCLFLFFASRHLIKTSLLNYQLTTKLMEWSDHATKKADFIELVDWQLNLLEKDPDAGKD